MSNTSSPSNDPLRGIPPSPSRPETPKAAPPSQPMLQSAAFANGQIPRAVTPTPHPGQVPHLNPNKTMIGTPSLEEKKSTLKEKSNKLILTHNQLIGNFKKINQSPDAQNELYLSCKDELQIAYNILSTIDFSRGSPEYIEQSLKTIESLQTSAEQKILKLNQKGPVDSSILEHQHLELKYSQLLERQDNLPLDKNFNRQQVSSLESAKTAIELVKEIMKKSHLSQADIDAITKYSNIAKQHLQTADEKLQKLEKHQNTPTALYSSHTPPPPSSSPPLQAQHNLTLIPANSLPALSQPQNRVPAAPMPSPHIPVQQKPPSHNAQYDVRAKELKQQEMHLYKKEQESGETLRILKDIPESNRSIHQKSIYKTAQIAYDIDVPREKRELNEQKLKFLTQKLQNYIYLRKEDRYIDELEYHIIKESLKLEPLLKMEESIKQAQTFLEYRYRNENLPQQEKDRIVKEFQSLQKKLDDLRHDLVPRTKALAELQTKYWSITNH